MVDEDFIKKLIKDRENMTLDLKLKITSKPKIAKTISAFANTAGGIILIGVADDGKMIGIDPDEEKFMVQSANEEFCTPQADIIFEDFTFWTDFGNQSEENEINLLLVFVSKYKGQKVLVLEKGKKKAYLRKNDQTLVDLNSQNGENKH
jgi:predicted HTH transcriptional regulator